MGSGGIACLPSRSYTLTLPIDNDRHFTRKKPGSDVFTEQDGYVYMKAADYM